jgi:serine/threonine-protein kinase
MNLAIGTQVDNYRIVEKIGEGGMGAVYRAVDVMLERDVALKFLHAQFSREPELVQRFRAEAMLLARLNHQFIAPIFGLHRHGDDLFIAMEYVPGETLDASLTRIGRFPCDAAIHVTSMLLQALDYAHRLGVVHRDIKPGNIILTPIGTAKVMDFGIARVLGSERRTRVGSIVGTIAYMAPEQIQGADTDQRADLYSVGVLLYEMLAGRVPFEGDTDWKLMQAQIHQAPPPLRERISLPEGLERVVMKALEKAPDARFQNAAEFQRAIDAVARQTGADPAAAPATAATFASLVLPAPVVPAARRDTSLDETRLAIPTPLPGTVPGLSPPGLPGQPAAPAPMPVVPAATPVPGPTPSVRAGAPAEAGAAGVPPVLPAVAASQPPAAARAGGERGGPTPAAAPAAAAAKKAPAAVARKSPVGRGVLVAGLSLLVAAAGALWVASRPASLDLSSLPQDTIGLSGEFGAVAPTENAELAPPPAAAPRTAAPNPPPAPAPGPAGPTPAETGRTAAATPTEGATAAGPPAPATPDAGAGGTTAESLPAEVFAQGVRWARRNQPEIDVELHFEPAGIRVANRGGRFTFLSFSYSSIAGAQYQESRHTRVFVRTTRYWLMLTGPEGQGILLRLERERVAGIIAALEKRWGGRVETTAPREEEEPG